MEGRWGLRDPESLPWLPRDAGGVLMLWVGGAGSPKLPPPTPVLCPHCGKGGEHGLWGKWECRGGLGVHRTDPNMPFSPRAVSPPWPVPWWSTLPSSPRTPSPNNSCLTPVSLGGLVCHGETLNPGALSPHSPLMFWGAPRAFP